MEHVKKLLPPPWVDVSLANLSQARCIAVTRARPKLSIVLNRSQPGLPESSGSKSLVFGEASNAQRW